MKNDIHITKFKQPASWTIPRDVKALCGAEILDAVLVHDFQFPERAHSNSHTCSGCQLLYNLQTEATGEPEWFYGVLNQLIAEKLKVNPGNTEEV